RPRPHLRRSCRPDAAGFACASQQRRERLGERACAPASHVAAGGHEASRCSVRRRPDQAHQNRPHCCLRIDAGADGKCHELAQSLSTLLARATRSPCRIRGERVMSAQPKVAAKPSLTLKRRLNAAPEKVYAAWTDPEKIVKWFGPDAGAVKSAVLDVRNGGRYSIVFSTENGEEHHVSGIYREVIPDERLNF